MSTTTTYTGVRIVDMPDLGAVTDDSSMVGEHAGSGRFAATAFRTYVAGLATGNVGRNYIHNGLFNIAQRAAGPWLTTQTYTADRWVMVVIGGGLTMTIQRATDATRAQVSDEAMEFVLGSDVAGGAGANDVAYFEQRIEDVRRLAGKTVTVSFWAAAGAGTPRLGVVLYQVFGSGGTPSPSVALPAQVTTLSTTYMRHALTFVVPTAAGRIFGTDAGTDYTILRFAMSSGANNDLAFGGIGVQTYLLGMWGVQLEIGTVATPLEKPDPQGDFANCRRFYQVGAAYFATIGIAGQGFIQTIPLTVQMRAVPTCTSNFITQTNCTGAVVSPLGSMAVYTTAVVTAANTQTVIEGGFTASADF